MANRILIRHGAGNPDITGNNPNLLPYELGWDTTNKALYINDNGVLISLSSLSGISIIAGTGLQFNNSTLNHSNSITAQTTQAIYPITVDALGHITSIGNVVSVPFFGTCTTAADLVIKLVTCTNFTDNDLVVGAVIFVQNLNTNSAARADLQLKVQNTAAKPIKYMYNNGVSNIPGNGYFLGGLTYLFHYDGTNWVIDNLHYNTNTTYTFDGGYNASTNPAATVTTVNNAIGAAIGGSY